MNDPKAQIVEKLKSSSNILVTVSAGPSVDQLAACIALTILLNKYKKSATAVFSGKVPSFLNFLKPEETVEKNTDSLRDFIISLDKSKADKLRYKVEDDVVKIFITPYKTSITPRDLKYSAGDFNVDLIIALGVHHQQDLDKAIIAHGRIFHDAVTMSINNSTGGDLGVANWEDVEASSLSELIADLTDALDPSLLDADIATALLTGIVAETGRFSNEKTHPRTMTVSSRLLEAGADQQLVNSQLQDLIGTVVNLEAGTEIKPTADTSKEPLHHNDVAEELQLGEDGSLKALETPKPAAQPSDDQSSDDQPDSSSDTMADGLTFEPLPDEPVAEEPIKETPVVPEVPQDQPLQGDVVADEAPAKEPVTETPKEPFQLPTQPQANMAPAPNIGWGSALAVPPLPPADDPIADEPPVQPEGQSDTLPAPDFAARNPLIQPIAPNQPSYSNPNTMTQYDGPAGEPATTAAEPKQPVNEPAPLGMSPADQPFTMPLPPTDSMPTPPAPAFGQAPTFTQAPPLPPADNRSNGNTPPPLPPPMPPNRF